MRQSLIFVFTTLALSVSSIRAQSTPQNQPLSNNDIIEMSRGGVPPSTIITAIQSLPAKFDTSPDGIIALHAVGVSQDVLDQMIRAGAPQRSPGAFGVATATFPVNDAAGQTDHYSAWIKTENVVSGYAGLWWRVDGQKQGEVLAFDNSVERLIDGAPATGAGVMRGATGTTGWTRYEFELPVPASARNINFGLLFPGTGAAWFDALSIELNGVPYVNPQAFDLDFESSTAKGFYTGGDGYKVGIDNTTAFSGRQSLKMQFIGGRNEPEPPRPIGIALPLLDPATVEDTSRSIEHDTPAPINFINRSGRAVDIYWIDYDGNRMLYRAGLADGASWQVRTFLTHPWLVVVSGTGGTTKRDTGVLRAGFEASTSSGGDAIITDRR